MKQWSLHHSWHVDTLLTTSHQFKNPRLGKQKIWLILGMKPLAQWTMKNSILSLCTSFDILNYTNEFILFMPLQKQKPNFGIEFST